MALYPEPVIEAWLLRICLENDEHLQELNACETTVYKIKFFYYNGIKTNRADLRFELDVFGKSRCVVLLHRPHPCRVFIKCEFHSHW
jgi:hypothetical protein